MHKTLPQNPERLLRRSRRKMPSRLFFLPGLQQQILKRNPINIGFNRTIEALPERDCRAFGAAHTGVGLRLQTGDWRQRPLGRAKDISRSICLRRLCQPVSAAAAAQTLQQTRAAQQRRDLLQIFYRNILARRNILKRYIAIPAVHRNINHHAKRISAFC